jgi:hypothetical protein
LKYSCFLKGLNLVFSYVSTNFSALSGGCLVCFLALPGTALFSATGHFIDGRPRATLGFFAAQATRFITFLDVLGLSFLFAGITGFITF